MTVSTVATPPPPVRRGEPEYVRITASFFFGGFCTFALLYSVQPLMPVFAREFSLSPANAALALSVTTLTMAPALVVAGSASEVFGRKRVMVISLAAAALASLAAASAKEWTVFLALRALTGLALSGLPAVAMAYLVDEIEGPALGLAMGLYIAGSTLGGMAGRLIVSVLVDRYDWRFAVASLAVEGLLGALLFLIALPRERRPGDAPDLARLLQMLSSHFADPGLRLLFAEGFLVMGAFVCTYNYTGFRLAAPPFSFSQTTIGLVFVLYLLGAVSSTVMGELAGRIGRRRVLWIAAATMLVGVLATLPNWLPAILFGVALITWGFFAAHSIASSWVGLRTNEGRAQAAALYLFFYYLGSSLAGWVGGAFYSRSGWPGVAVFLVAMAVAAVAVAMRLASVPPPKHLQTH